MGLQNPLAATVAKTPGNDQTQLGVDSVGNLLVNLAAGAATVTSAAVAATNSGTAGVAGLAVGTVAGALYGATVQNLGTATAGGFAMVLNDTSVPATGTLATGIIADVRAVGCGTVPGAGTATFTYDPPLELSSGAVLVFSSTAPPVMTTVSGGMFGAGRFKAGA